MLFLKRFLIIALTLSVLTVLEVSSDESILNSKPSQEDVLKRISDRNQQEEILKDLLNSNQDRKQKEDYADLFDLSIKHTFIIEFTTEEWEGLINDMETYFEQFGSYKSNNYRNVTVTYIADDEIFTIEDVGIRSKGNIYSRTLPVDSSGNVLEIHYMLKFNETFDLDENTTEYDALKKREVFNIEQLLFKRNNTGDPSYLNEIYSYHMFEEAGVPIPQGTLAEVRIVIDGKVENIYLYNVFEHFDEEFIRNSIQDEPTKEVGDLYKGSYSGTLDPITESYLYGIRNWETNHRPIYSLETNKDYKRYGVLINFSEELNNPNLVERKTFLQNNFEIDNFIRAMAINVLTGNPDDYRGNGNNFYYYFDENQVMTYLPFDYDNSFGSGWTGTDNGTPFGNGHCNYTLCNDIYEWAMLPWANFGIPLWDNVIVYEEYQLLYEDYLMEYIDSGLFSVEAYQAMFDQAEALYGDDHEMIFDKAYFINEKIRVVTEDVEYYRNQR